MNTGLVDPAPGLLGRQVTRRAALGRLAGAGAALATTGLITSPVFAGQEEQGETMNQATPSTGAPTIVLVHGGFAGAMVVNPASCSRSMTLLQLEVASAKPPCTRTMVGAPVLGVAWFMVSPCSSWPANTGDVHGPVVASAALTPAT